MGVFFQLCYFGHLILKQDLVVKFACVMSSFIRAIMSSQVNVGQSWNLNINLAKKMFTSASTLGVKTSSDIEDFLVFSGGVVELAVGCVGITLGVVGTAIPGVGSTIG